MEFKLTKSGDWWEVEGDEALWRELSGRNLEAGVPYHLFSSAITLLVQAGATITIISKAN